MKMRDEFYDNARWVIAAIARGLDRRASRAAAQVLDRLSEQPMAGADFRLPEPRGLPVVRYLPQCLGEAMLYDADLAAAIAAVEESLDWRQSAHYSDAVSVDGFTKNYGRAELIGPHGFFGGNDFLLGLLLLGPGSYYRERIQVAPELYWPLTTSSLWSISGGCFVAKEQGAMIWHPSMTMHATKTGDAPLLAVWSWVRDTSVPARLVEA